MEENKTLKGIRDALAKCHGHKETVALIYCDNGQMTSTEAFVGSAEHLTAAIHAMLDRIGEGRAMPSEVAITYAMLNAIAASDLAHGGALTEAINRNKQLIMEVKRQQEPKPKGEA